MHSPRYVVLHFKIENDVVIPRKIKRFLKRRNSLSRKLAVIPLPRVEFPQVGQCCVMNRSMPVRRALERRIVDRNEFRVARKVRSFSMKPAPSSTARRNAASVFSGAWPDAPRCAITQGARMKPIVSERENLVFRDVRARCENRNVTMCQ